ncbi:hypothetical protein EVAR_30942_1 [Eumeta japonica]|uniref:Uncharacterized protein n=1 Tax=Eumeta variegata TaxID=151549 RepID=A0A4C1V4Z3_EUMVA|nr:hypothetical protein EVAR_30942_1 [Eumeta japonica]
MLEKLCNKTANNEDKFKAGYWTDRNQRRPCRIESPGILVAWTFAPENVATSCYSVRQFAVHNPTDHIGISSDYALDYASPVLGCPAAKPRVRRRLRQSKGGFRRRRVRDGPARPRLLRTV